jgi:hypothetical protein
MAAMHRELSGAFSDEAKWRECWKQLSSDGICSINTLRIYHNSQQQLLGTAHALLHNSTVTQFDIGVVNGLEAAQGLAELLKVRCRRHTCCMYHFWQAAAASAVLSMYLQWQLVTERMLLLLGSTQTFLKMLCKRCFSHAMLAASSTRVSAEQHLS